MSDNMGNVVADGNEGQTAPTTTSTNTASAGNDKTFSQDEVNAIVTKRLSQLEKKYQGIDVNEYQELKTIKQQQETEQAIKRQEFDKVLTQVKSAAEQKISALQKELETIKIDGALIAEASTRKAVAPDKVAALLRSQLKLTQEGAVEVLDSTGQVRYNADKATPLAIGELVDEFLKQNPYFVQASPAGSGARSHGQEAGVQNIDMTSLDMRKPEHREIYRKMQNRK
jgi:hypothetical protein